MLLAHPSHPTREARLVTSSLPTSTPQATSTSILIVEDHEPTQRILAQSLAAANYRSVIAGRGADALQIFRAQAPDLVLLDLMLPDIDGLAVCRAVRAESVVPILVLSGLSDEAQQVALLDAGADDYLVKPVRREELLARIRRALARSLASAPAVPAVYQLGDMRVDVARRHVWRGEELAQLTPTEWTLLVSLLQSPEHMLPYTQLCVELWPGEVLRASAALHSVIKRLRRKLDGAVLIVNMRGVGYRLDGSDADLTAR